MVTKAVVGVESETPFLTTSNGNGSESFPIGESPSAGEQQVALTMMHSIGRQPRVGLSPTGLILPADITVAEFRELGKSFVVAQRAIQWAIGDYCILGEKRFVMSVADVAQATGYDEDTIRTYVHVADAFPAERRRAGLAWSIHEELADLPIRDQDRWLNEAAEHRYTVRELRAYLAAERRRTSPDLDFGPDAVKVGNGGDATAASTNVGEQNLVARIEAPEPQASVESPVAKVDTRTSNVASGEIIPGAAVIESVPVALPAPLVERARALAPGGDVAALLERLLAEWESRGDGRGTVN